MSPLRDSAGTDAYPAGAPPLPAGCQHARCSVTSCRVEKTTLAKRLRAKWGGYLEGGQSPCPQQQGRHLVSLPLGLPVRNTEWQARRFRSEVQLFQDKQHRGEGGCSLSQHKACTSFKNLTINKNGSLHTCIAGVNLEL